MQTVTSLVMIEKRIYFQYIISIFISCRTFSKYGKRAVGFKMRNTPRLFSESYLVYVKVLNFIHGAQLERVLERNGWQSGKNSVWKLRTPETLCRFTLDRNLFPTTDAGKGVEQTWSWRQRFARVRLKI